MRLPFKIPLSVSVLVHGLALFLQFLTFAGTVVPDDQKPLFSASITIGQAVMGFLAHYSLPPSPRGGGKSASGAL